MNTQMNVPPGMAMALDTQARLMVAQGQFTPVKKDGGLTVAAQNLAALSQREAAKQAETASGIEAMKQRQMQQALQQMLAKQSAPPAPLASGIGALGADVKMAEGGVVGYSGEEGSEVDLPVNERFKRLFKNLYERMGLADKRAAYLQRTGARPEVIAQTLAAETAAPTAAPTVATDTGDEYDKLRSRYKRPTTPQEIEARVKEQPGTSYQPDARLFSSAAQRKPAPEAVVKPAETGVASLMGPAVPSGSERQFGEAMSALGRMEIPKERKPEDIAAERAAYYRSQGIDPNFMQARTARLEAQERRDQEEAAARAKLVEGRGMENLISRLTRAGGARSGLAGLAQAQLGMEPIIAGQRAGDERFNALMRERQREADRERSAMEDMQRALADGDIARAEKSRDAAFAARNAKNATEAEMRGKYAPQLLQAETAAMEVAARAKEGAANRENQVLVAKLQLSKPSDLQERIALLNKDPDKFKRIYGDKTAVDLAELRAKLLADYSKNATQLTLQGIKSFDDYVAMYTRSAAGAAPDDQFKVLSSRPK